MLYILVYNDKTIHSLWDKWVTVHEDEIRFQHLLHKVLTETALAQPIVSSYPLPISMIYPWDINHNNSIAMYQEEPYTNHILLLLITVATYMVGELKILVWFIGTWMLKREYCYNWCFLDAMRTRIKGNYDMISCATIVSVSTSCNRHLILALSSCCMTQFPYVY